MGEVGRDLVPDGLRHVAGGVAAQQPEHSRAGEVGVQDPQPSWLMSSTTPSATRKSASLARLQVENGRSCSAGLDLASFLIFRR